MDIFCKIGDTIGYIRKSQKFGETVWRWGISETKVNRLAICKDGVHVYTKNFCPLNDDEIRSNTEIMRENTRLILVQEPFSMDEEIRARVTRWIDWMNEDPENEKKASDFADSGNGSGSSGRVIR